MNLSTLSGAGTAAPLSSTSAGGAGSSRLARVVGALWSRGRGLSREVAARLGYIVLAGALAYAALDLQSDRLVALYALPAIRLPGAFLTTVDLGEPIWAGERLAVLYAGAAVWPALLYHLWALGVGVVGAPTQRSWAVGLAWLALSGPLHLYAATALLWPPVALAVSLLALESLPGALAAGDAVGGVRLLNAVETALTTLWASLYARALPGALFWLAPARGWTPRAVRRARWAGVLAVLMVGVALLPAGLGGRLTTWTLLLGGLELVWYRWSLAGPRQLSWLRRLGGPGAALIARQPPGQGHSSAG